MKIMAPAGDRERLTAALKGGADEVYMGVTGFGARRFAPNFSVDEYCAAIDLAHQNGVAVNLTLNTIMSDEEINEVAPWIAQLYKQGLDAVIIQDWGVARWLHANFPDLELHASTQLSLAHANELNWLAEHGFRRAVLARELTLNELADIRKQTNLDLEVFVSGALCLSCSGKCYLSSFIGGRSGNRGMCTQPCRQLYRILESERVSDEGYFLSLKDQWQDEKEIQALMDIGINSIKIEGRMKSPEYVYETVRYYRSLIDKINQTNQTNRQNSRTASSSSRQKESSSKESSPKFVAAIDGQIPVPSATRVARLFNRGYAKGYYYEADPSMLNRHYSSNFGVEIGKVRDGKVYLSETVRNGDGIVYLDEDLKKLSGQNVSRINLIDNPWGRFHKVESAQGGDIVQFGEVPPENAHYVYRTNDYALIRELDNLIQQTNRYLPVDALLKAYIGKPLQLTLTSGTLSVSVAMSGNLEESKKHLTEESALKESLDRFGGSSFYLNRCEIKMDRNVFVPKSELNRLRQEASAQLAVQLVESHRRAPKEPVCEKFYPAISNDSRNLDREEILDRLAVCVRTEIQQEICRKFGIKNIYSTSVPVRFDKDWEKEFTAFSSGSLTSERLPLAGSLAEAIWLEQQGVPFATDWFFNIGNSQSLRFLMENFSKLRTIYLSPELSERTCKDLAYWLKRNKEKIKPCLALPIYGYLPGMTTRKTLFELPVIQLLNQDNRPITVVRNKSWFERGTQQSMTGSTIYDAEPLDLLDAIPWILKSGFSEVRLDFSKETGAEVLALLKRATEPERGCYSIHSYGFGKGIF